MELIYIISLIFIFILNVLFFFSGICLNSLVILSFWRTTQLRKKLCYFMIMVLSCCDLLVVLTCHPLLAFIAMVWLTEKFNALPKWMYSSLWLTNNFVCFSLLALLVMNFDRYLATYYPIFHRTSVTKGKLLALLATLIAVEAILHLMSVKNFVFSHTMFVLIFFIITLPPMLFINYKLLTVARNNRRNNGISPEIKKTFSWKNVSSCLLAVAAFGVMSIPILVYIGLSISALDHAAELVGVWAQTIASFNSTFNCLIFYWKNKILRTEGMKVINKALRCAES